MRHIMIGVAIAVALCASGVVAAKEDDGWIELFNGKDLDNWEQKNGKATYKVEDGCIVGTSAPKSPNSFLCTKEEFDDFILEFEFKAHPKLNSGVQIRSKSLPNFMNGRVHGYQCELEQEDQERDWSGGIYDEARRGWLYPDKDDKELCAKFGKQGRRLWKKGEWNKLRIECKGDRIRTWLNGELRADLKDDMTSSGFIGLQVHGVGDKKEPMSVMWRNIRLKKLD